VKLCHINCSGPTLYVSVGNITGDQLQLSSQTCHHVRQRLTDHRD